MNGNRPTESDLLQAREDFWQEVRGKLRDEGLPEYEVQQLVEGFRSNLKQQDVEQWAYHDGAAAVAKRLQEQLRDDE